MKEIIFLNGKFMLRQEGQLPLLTPGFLYGWGLFESMRSYNNKIVYFDEHLRRLRKSAALLDMRCPYALAKLREIILQTVRINGISDAYVRMTLWKSQQGADILVSAKPYRPYPLLKYRRGFSACISSFRQNEGSLLAQLKTTNYLLCRLSSAQAAKKGFDEAVILNHRGYIAEASRSNLFFVKGKDLFTPSLSCGCLEGITRQVIFDLAKKYNIRAFEGNFTVNDLCASDGAFLTNSLMGIMPLAYIGKERMGKGKIPCKLTRFLMGKYKSLLGNEA